MRGRSVVVVSSPTPICQNKAPSLIYTRPMTDI